MTMFANWSPLPGSLVTHEDGTEFARPRQSVGCWRVSTTWRGMRLVKPTQCNAHARKNSLCCVNHRRHEESAQAFKRSLEGR